jgi:ribosome-associated protein
LSEGVRVIKANLKALAIAGAASDKKALDIITIDMRKVSGVCDWFVIASGASTTQVRAIADHISRKLKDKGERLWHMEGAREGLWVLLDYGDVVAHIFLEETRRFYDLERLWGDAPQTRYKEPPRVKPAVRKRKPTRRKKPVRKKKPARKKTIKRRRNALWRS